MIVVGGGILIFYGARLAKPAALTMQALTSLKPLPTKEIADSPPSMQVLPSPSVVTSPEPDENEIFFPVVVERHANLPCQESPEAEVNKSDPLSQNHDDAYAKWHPVVLSFSGPELSEDSDDPNPFLDYRLQVFLLSPTSKLYNVPGFFVGDGQGNGLGSIWQARFSPDEVGLWKYCVSFRTGRNIAIELDLSTGEPAAFDGALGEFEVIDLDLTAPGFLKWGRLEYVGGHYLKFRDGPYWIKGGTNSPENFLGYKGFDNTIDQGGIIDNFVHSYAPHVSDWKDGDPEFQSIDTGYDGKGIIGALNYLSLHGINSVYFLPLNLGGDGQETYPFISPDGGFHGNTHYDISKLHQWNIVLDHAQRRGIALHIVLNETEARNRQWLDEGFLDLERKLFYREMVARFSYLLAVKWNLSEEIVFSGTQIAEFADYIQALDWASHPLTFHNPAGAFKSYEDFLGDFRISATSFQYEGARAGEIVETWRLMSESAGRPWVIDLDENNPAGEGLSPWNTGELRKEILYDGYFSGGSIEWYAGYHDLPEGGDVNLEDFRTREKMWDYMHYARRFMENNLPFWQMYPADELLNGETTQYGGGEVLALEGEIYAVYLPAAEPSGVLTVPNLGQSYLVRWYNPRTGEFSDNPLMISDEEGFIELGQPPSDPQADWVVMVAAVGEPIDLTPPASYP